MKKILGVILASLAMTSPAFASDALLVRDVIPPAMDKMVIAVDFASFTDCIDGVHGTNERRIPQGYLNPRGLTVSNPNIPATGILQKSGERPTTCVATEYIAHN